MNYKQATTSQLYTIVYHESCASFIKMLALQELSKRDKQVNGRVNARIKRKIK